VKPWLLILGLGVWCFPTARAAQPVIRSFDANGSVVFEQAPGAVFYWVEWTTNLVSGMWSSNAPGLAYVSSQGGSLLTVTVGVVHVSCFYRVAAAMTNPPALVLSNAFAVSNESWVVVSYPFRSHVAAPATTTASHDGAFGNPAGSVRVGDVHAETGVAAPSSYLGNKLNYYGGRLLYDIYIRYSDNATYPAVVLNGGTKSLYYDTPSPPIGSWQRRTIPLAETGWRVAGSGQAASEAVFKEVLGQLVGLYIYTEWHSGTDDTNVDNISLLPPD